VIVRRVFIVLVAVFVIAAGLAFARSMAQRPELNLYAADKRHPSLASTYLAACTVYAALFNKSPVGSRYTAGLEPTTARFLQAGRVGNPAGLFRPQWVMPGAAAESR